jgi:hypothetical protein
MATPRCSDARVPWERAEAGRVLRYGDNWIGTTMSYRAYSGPRGSEAIAPLDKDRLLYKEFDSLDAALAWARHVIDGGRLKRDDFRLGNLSF